MMLVVNLNVHLDYPYVLHDMVSYILFLDYISYVELTTLVDI